MPVATFIQPDFDGTHAADGTGYKTAIDNAIAAMAGIGDAFACHEQSSPDMTVRVDSGVLTLGGVATRVAAQDTGTITAPSANPRYTLVYLDPSDGSVGLENGTEAASPSEPAVPSGMLPLAAVYLTPSTTSISNQALYDRRLLGGATSATTFENMPTRVQTAARLALFNLAR
jgi:hypothetical protein